MDPIGKGQLIGWPMLVLGILFLVVWVPVWPAQPLLGMAFLLAGAGLLWTRWLLMNRATGVLRLLTCSLGVALLVLAAFDGMRFGERARLPWLFPIGLLLLLAAYLLKFAERQE